MGEIRVLQPDPSKNLNPLRGMAINQKGKTEGGYIGLYPRYSKFKDIFSFKGGKNGTSFRHVISLRYIYFDHQLRKALDILLKKSNFLNGMILFGHKTILFCPNEVMDNMLFKRFEMFLEIIL